MYSADTAEQASIVTPYDVPFLFSPKRFSYGVVDPGKGFSIVCECCVYKGSHTSLYKLVHLLWIIQKFLLNTYQFGNAFFTKLLYTTMHRDVLLCLDFCVVLKS